MKGSCNANKSDKWYADGMTRCNVDEQNGSWKCQTVHLFLTRSVHLRTARCPSHCSSPQSTWQVWTQMFEEPTWEDTSSNRSQSQLVEQQRVHGQVRRTRAGESFELVSGHHVVLTRLPRICCEHFGFVTLFSSAQQNKVRTSNVRVLVCTRKGCRQSFIFWRIISI